MAVPARTLPVHDVPARGPVPVPSPGAGTRRPDVAALRSDDLAILVLLARGLPMDTLARRVGLSERTVRRRCRQVCDRLGVDTPIEAVVWAVRRGLL